MTLNPAIAPLDAILAEYKMVIGKDLAPYRNHTYRIANFCLALAPSGADTVEKVGIAAAFHDLGIWTDHTFDYLEPSVRLAVSYLEEKGKAAWIPEISEMIRQHHKISRYRAHPQWLVEPFRRADWADVTLGLLPAGVPRAVIRAAYITWPSVGFHWRLVELEAGHLRRHPLNPLPVFRL